MVRCLREIATLPFDGDIRKGPRHTYILSYLMRHGCHPTVDSHGNIWVERGPTDDGSGRGPGEGTKTILISSHLDVDPRVKGLDFSYYTEGRRKMVRSVLDNAVGCCLNLRLAVSRSCPARTIHVFTASEEVEKDNPRRFCRSAREVVRELRSSGIKPDFCTVIDVTFPRLLVEDIHWGKRYDEQFDLQDKTHCYIDGYSSHSEKKLVLSLMRRVKGKRIGVRYLHGHDEAFVYSRLCHSFAFGPVVFGDFAAPDQVMPLAHMRTAYGFLRKILYC